MTDILSTPDGRVVLDYTSRDYKSIRAMLVGLAQGFLPEWGTVGEAGDFGTLLLELFAYSGDVLNYYIDRVGAEAFLGTAARRQSVMYIADMLGYTPVGQHAASTPVKFTWSWDAAETQITPQTFSVNYLTIENNLVTVQLTNPDYAVDLVVEQTITVTGLDEFGLNGAYVVDSVLPASDGVLFTLTFEVPAELGVIPTESPVTTFAKSPQLSTGLTIIIPEGTTVFTNADANGQVVSFETDYDVFLDSAIKTVRPTPGFVATEGAPDPSTVYQVTGTATASEGATVNPTKIGVSKGIPSAEMVLPDIGIIDGSVLVFTKEGGQVVTWARLSNLAVARPTQSAYAIYVDDQDLTHIVFGDNASGRIPPVSSEVHVGYRVGVGAQANKLVTGSITSFNNDYANGLGVTVTNTAAPTGGSDIESTESMRFSIPRANALRQRAVNLDDYKALALQVPGVAKATAYGDNYTEVYIRVAASAQSIPYQTDVVNYMRTLKGQTTLFTRKDNAPNLRVGQVIYAITHIMTGSFEVVKIWSANPTQPIHISSMLSSADIVTITTLTPHGLSLQQPVTIAGLPGLGSSGVNPANGTWSVGAIKDAKNFQIRLLRPLDGTSYNQDFAATAITDGLATVVTAPGVVLKTPNQATLGLRRGIETTGTAPGITYTDPAMQLLIEATEAYLSDKTLIGSVTYAEPVDWTDIIIDVTITVRALYNRTSVAKAVKAAVALILAFDTVDFGTRISMGDVYRAILGVDGVEFGSINSLYTGSTPSVGDIVTKDHSLPRMQPKLATDDLWLHSTGGLAGT